MHHTVLTFSQFDTGAYSGSEFLMAGGDAVLTVHLSGLTQFQVQFSCVRWHQFTALYNCSPEQIQAYFCVVEIADSPTLSNYIRDDRASKKAYRELHHYRVFLDETGCHELFAENCRAI